MPPRKGYKSPGLAPGSHTDHTILSRDILLLLQSRRCVPITNQHHGRHVPLRPGLATASKPDHATLCPRRVDLRKNRRALDSIGLSHIVRLPPFRLRLWVSLTSAQWILGQENSRQMGSAALQASTRAGAHGTLPSPPPKSRPARDFPAMGRSSSFERH